MTSVTNATCRACGKDLGFPARPASEIASYYCSLRCYHGGADQTAGTRSIVRDDSDRAEIVEVARLVSEGRSRSYVQAAADLAAYVLSQAHRRDEAVVAAEAVSDAQIGLARVEAERDGLRAVHAQATIDLASARATIEDVYDELFSMAIDEDDVRHQLVDHRTDGADLAHRYAAALRKIRDRIDAFYEPIVEAMEARAAAREGRRET